MQHFKVNMSRDTKNVSELARRCDTSKARLYKHLTTKF